MSTEAVDEYSERMLAGDEFPPLQAARLERGDPRVYLVGGWHRFEALRKVGTETVAVNVVAVATIEDAILESCRENTSHGIRRTQADKRRVVTSALGADSALSDSSIADLCGVSHTFVAEMRRELGTPAADVRKGRDGITRALPLPAVDDGPVERDDLDPNSLQCRMREASIAFDAIIDQVEATIESVSGFCEKVEAAFISQQSVASDGRNLLHTIEAGRPFKICPLCAGEQCRTCRDQGWVSRQQWHLIPKDQRA